MPNNGMWSATFAFLCKGQPEFMPIYAGIEFQSVSFSPLRPLRNIPIDSHL
jgi:hypothetical protein